MSEIDLNLLPDFIVDTAEHLNELETLLMQLIETPDDLQLLNEIFRPVHTIKGSAQYIGIGRIAKLAHRLEDLLDILREGKKPCTGDMIMVFMKTRDRFVQLLEELESEQEERTSVDDLIAAISGYIESDISPEQNADKSVESDDPIIPDDQGYLHEKSDQELLRIFLNHHNETLENLDKLGRYLKDSKERKADITRCIELVKRLRSSSNYMRYRELVNIYDEWISELEDVSEQSEQGDDTAFYFMNLYFTRVNKRLSNYKGMLEEPVENSMGPESDSEGFEQSDDDTDMPSLEELHAAAFNEGSVGQLSKKSDDNELSDIIADPAMVPDFVIESVEHLEELEKLLLELNEDYSNTSILNDIFRCVHTIKGSAQYIGIPRVAGISHHLEDLLNELREERIRCTADIVALLIQARDRLSNLLTELDADCIEKSPVDDLMEKIDFHLDRGGSDGVNDSSQVDDAPVYRVAVTPQEGAYHEEYDTELFEIFLNHLNEQIRTLKYLQKEIQNQTDAKQNLYEAIDTLNRLISSANYMGYDALINCYIHAKELTENRLEAVNKGERVSLDYLDNTYADIEKLFPGLIEMQNQEIESNINELESNISDSLIENAGEGMVNDELFTSLNDALNESMRQVSKIENDTLNSVYDEIVSHKDNKQKRTEQNGESRRKSNRERRITDRRTAADRRGNKNKIEGKVKRSLRVDSGKIDSLMNQVGELIVDRSYFHQLYIELGLLQQKLKENSNMDQKEIKAIRTFSYRFGEAISALGRTSNELQGEVMKMRMLPISQLFNRYPRLIHDLTNNTDKKVNLVIRGEDTELDKMIVEEISDPLVHIIRNSVDHGIESSEWRKNHGKKEVATLILEAYQESNHIVIEVTDDGKGIDHEKIKNKALEKGLFSLEELSRMNMRDLNQVILTPGFSTADKITGTSGRGVGMDVVKQNIDKLNGSLEIESKLGSGTRMRLKIPLTLGIIHALMVRVGKEMFTIPLPNVDETVRIQEQDISTVEGVEVIYLRGQTLPIFRLSKLFMVPRDEKEKNISVVIVERNAQRTGFVVDELLGQEEVVIKPLADYVQHRSGFSGATIVGDGRISLILDVYELVRMTEKKQALKQRKQAEALKSKLKNKNSGNNEKLLH